MISQAQIAGTSFTPFTPLDDNHAYAFRARAGNGLGYGDWGDWGFAHTGTVADDWVLPNGTGGSGSGGCGGGASVGGDGIAYSPKYKYYRSWEPLNWNFSDSFGMAVAKRITYDQDQGRSYSLSQY